MPLVWMNTLRWAGAAGVAVLLACLAPREPGVHGQLPDGLVARLGGPASAQDSPPLRRIALITFSGAHRPEADSWVRGLALDAQPDIAWVRMPVLHDPGDARLRDALEQRIRRHYPAPADQAALVPVFADRARFAREAGLQGTDHAQVVVLNPQGEVLEQVSGAYAPEKAEALRQRLRAPL